MAGPRFKYRKGENERQLYAIVTLAVREIVEEMSRNMQKPIGRIAGDLIEEAVTLRPELRRRLGKK